ncbi:SPOR domain-containing protein [Pseudodesulfovibrio piezophilus]|uniref:Sporulation domain protein n=1 Tax=Pseudodesulfovibrio piezophilus (strain DSM 21447 / JCM 15486 / C1TLV30) TaxID=1322246 RepID=M1WTB3_PSEP2|nr:SPOR domain-containing protein [Pseudodesulfovibrio piezophilus]CCH49407.1 Sporulation domain protein [Pseudodesulfovibrio piezophilus C1TLV30]
MKKHLCTLLSTVAAVMVVFSLGGCFRKHIVSSPPAQRPAQSVKAAPQQAVRPEVVEETPEVIEETYVVDAPTEANAPAPKVEESDLAEESVGKVEEKVTASAAEAAPAKAEITAEVREEKETLAAVSEAMEETSTVMTGGAYYIQVGAFSDLENANKALSKLIAAGYKGSQLVRTDTGLFRVQAGAFSTQEEAEDALMELLSSYPKGFVLQNTSE